MKLMSAVLLAFGLFSCATTYQAHGEKAGGETEVICHKGNKTMVLPSEAVEAHIGHGDQLGPCSGP